MIDPHHHKHIRKRVHKKKLHPYPSKKASLRMLDLAVAVLGVGSIFAIIPQAVEIWGDKDGSGVSLITWGYFTMYVATMLIYGIAHREKPIIYTYSINILVYILVVVGLIIY